MEKAYHDLVLMVRLQTIYDRIAAALKERATPPAEVQALQETNLRRQVELEEIEKQLEQHGHELREVRRKEQEYELELQHFQRQKAMVTNEREFTAVISEIDYATKAHNEASERRRELQTAIDQLDQDLASRKAARPEEESAQREVVEHWDARKAELKDEVHDLATQAKEIEDELQPPNRARFLRLLESKRGTAMAAAVDGSCSLCHFALRPHLQQRVRRCEEIITCEHCHRILFLSELVEAETAEAK